ncbi:hypothetical protein J6590_061268 [Homalodisca vitripennis]|nr:hypothetical protein J6590_061268 [Homalodisca vitripennis]
MVKSLVTAETALLGVCKPGASLLGVVEGSQPPPPGSCSVLIAEANYIGAGRSSTIYQQLENQISMRPVQPRSWYQQCLIAKTSSSHHVNQQTTRVNNYIRELCIRCKGSVLLDSNAIGRRHFTRHGQHLTMRGKRMLAELVVAGQKKASLVTDYHTPHHHPITTNVIIATPTASITATAATVKLLPLSATDVESPEIAVTEPAGDVAVSCVPLSPDGPWTLPYNSYAEAVKSPPLMTNGRSADLVQAGIDSFYLGTPL